MITKILEKIRSAKKILLISHVNPDGDTLGSMCAFNLMLKSRADMLIQTSKGFSYPKIYEFLPKISEAKNLCNVQNIYDVVITFDVAALERMTGMGRKIFDSAECTINFDHHKTNDNFADINIVNTDVSSCGEIIYNFFKEAKVKITKDMADCLYVAILTDTGGFRYENTKTSTFEVVEDLVKLGVDISDIASRCYDNKPKEMVMFQAAAICNAKFLFNEKLAYSIIKLDDMKKMNAKNEHTEGICETLRSISGVEIAFIAKEIDKNLTKFSLRSKNVDLAKITEKFKGGGHKKSAGCSVHMDVMRATDKMIEEIEKSLKE